MYTTRSLYLLVTLFWINSVKCDVCEFANLDYKAIVEVESLEKISIQKLQSELPTLKYTVNNATLSGFHECKVIHTQCSKMKTTEELTFQFHIQCPELTLTYDYEADGEFSSLLIQGHGSGVTNFEDYVVMIDGIYESVVGKDKVARPVIKKYTLDTDPRGIVKFKMQNTYHGDKERDKLANKFLNENWRMVEKMLKSPIIDEFMKYFVKNINAYSTSM